MISSAMMRFLAALAALAGSALAAARPNFIVILTDDQDATMKSIDFMPYVQKLLVDKGTTYAKHYCTVAICCPSRVNLWTGQLAHNTNITDVAPPYGGYPKFAERYSDRHLAVWMQQAGYNTYYAGKLFNHHAINNYDKPLVRGFTKSEFLLDPTTYQYWNFSTTLNGGPPVTHEGVYSPDYTAQSVYEFLEDALADDEKPFFLVAAPIAPHGSFKLGPKFETGPPDVAPRHQDMFEGYKITRTPDFNSEAPAGVDWIAQLPKLNDTEIDYNDDFQRRRMQSLQAVDDMVGTIVKRLYKADQLENTYIFYTSDNGYHISQHRLHPGKGCSFETDINVPFIVRGPKVPPGLIKKGVVTSHTDLAPTVMHLAGLPLRPEFDGHPIAVHNATNVGSEHVLTEFWGSAFPEGKYGGQEAAQGLIEAYYGLASTDTTTTGPMRLNNNTYRAVRIVSVDYDLYYVVWCTNDRQFYDMKYDPYQVHNLIGLPKEGTLFGRQVTAVVRRLDALLLVLKSCKGRECVEPWRRYHPNGNVTKLEEALYPSYDPIYDMQPTVSFSSCERGYIREAEGPQHVRTPSTGSVSEQYVVDPNWSLWT